MSILEYYETKEHIILIEELYTGGELMDRLADLKTFSEKDAAVYISQILAAVNYCHKKNIVHR